MNYKSPLCSCIVCHETKSVKGIFSHYLASHGTKEERESIVPPNRKKSDNKVQKENATKRREIYNSNPNFCTNCNSKLDYKTRNNKYCSRSCSATVNNSNRIVTEEQKNKTSESVKQFLFSLSDEEYLNYIRSTHPNKNISKIEELRIRKIPQDIVGEYTKIYLCTCKYTGKLWYSTTIKQIHPSCINSKKDYSYQCRFNFSISKYNEWFLYTSELINKYGWYSTPGSRSGIKNLNGCSRDHLYSVSDGFKNNVDPKIISHPANCDIKPHSINQIKNSKSSITLEELMSRIERFENIYGRY
jgi:hypothetical protein